MSSAIDLVDSIYPVSNMSPDELADRIYDWVDQLDDDVCADKADLYAMLTEALTPHTEYLDAVVIVQDILYRSR